MAGKEIKKYGDRLAPIWSAHFQPRPDRRDDAWKDKALDAGAAHLWPRLEQLLGIEVVSLAAASRDLGRRCVCRYQASRKLDASVDEPVCAPAKFGAGPNLRNIVLHVLGRPTTTVGDKWGNCGKEKPSSPKTISIWPATAWTLSCPPITMKAATLLRISTRSWISDLVLSTAIQPFCHLEVERTGTTPTDGCGDQHNIGPEDQHLIDRVELIGGIHLRDRAGPCASMGALRVVTFASAEAQIVETDQARFDA